MEPQNQSSNHEAEHPVSPEQSQSVPEKTKQSSISIPAAIITGAVIIALALILVMHPKTSTAPDQGTTDTAADETPTSVKADVVTVRPEDHVRGDAAKAEVIIFEYSDSDCPYCVRFHPTLVQLVDEYKGRVAFVYRYFPLNSLHPNAYTEALALECVGDLGGNNAFQNYLDTIINVTLNADPKSNEALTTFAKNQGIDEKAFKACMANPATAQSIDASIAEAESIGAQGTPFSVAVNVKTGKQVVIAGAYPIESVRKDIDSLLK